MVTWFKKEGLSKVVVKPLGVPGSPCTWKPWWRPGCQMPIAAWPASFTTAMVPSSPTAMGATITCPPLAAAASLVASASSVARYTDHTSGMPDWPSLRMPPATFSPSLKKVM